MLDHATILKSSQLFVEIFSHEPMHELIEIVALVLKKTITVCVRMFTEYAVMDQAYMQVPAVLCTTNRMSIYGYERDAWIGPRSGHHGSSRAGVTIRDPGQGRRG